MNKIYKLIGFISMLAIVVGLTSCNDTYDFYKDWSEAGAQIEEENIYTTISLSELTEKREAEETFAVIVATSQSSSAVSTIGTLQAQADYLGFEGTIYFVDATNYIETTDARRELRSATNMVTAISTTTAQAVVLCYTNGSKTLDTSNTAEGARNGEYYLVSGTVNFERLSYYLFTKFFVVTEA